MDSRKEREAFYFQHYASQEPAYFEHFFPTGKIVIANDLRWLFAKGVNYNVNSPEGTCLTTRDYAQLGMAHYYVGNSCPGVWYDRNRGMAIGATARDAHDCRGDATNPGRLPYRQIGRVCTDLWWISIIDEVDYFRLGGTEAYLKKYADRATIEPGRYVGRGFYGYKNHRSPNIHEFGRAGVMVALCRSDDPIPELWQSPLTKLTRELLTEPCIRKVDISQHLDFDKNHADTTIRVCLPQHEMWISHRVTFVQVIQDDVKTAIVDKVKRMIRFVNDPIKFLTTGSTRDLEVAIDYLCESGGIRDRSFQNLMTHGHRESPHIRKLATEILGGDR